MDTLGPAISNFIVHSMASEIEPLFVEISAALLSLATQIITGAVSAMFLETLFTFT